MISFFRHIPAGDLALVNGTTRVVRDAEQAAQGIDTALDTFLGEYFLDLRIGMPYFRDVLIKNPNPEVVRSVFRKAIKTRPGIVSVPELDVTTNASTGKMLVTFTAVYEDGSAIAQAKELII